MPNPHAYAGDPLKQLILMYKALAVSNINSKFAANI